MRSTDTRAVLVALGANVARLRRRGELTQAQLAERLDIETSYLQALEYGSKTPSLGMIVRIANELEVKVSVLFREAKPIKRKRGRPTGVGKAATPRSGR